MYVVIVRPSPHAEAFLLGLYYDKDKANAAADLFVGRSWVYEREPE